MSFYRQVAEDRFEATPLTRGPWDARSQHAGPPAALIGRAVECRPGARADSRVVRITFDIARPVPIGPLTVSTRVVRSGRSVEVVEAELTPDGGPAAMRATAVLIRTADGAAPGVPGVAPPPGPETAREQPFPLPYDEGYHTAMETRFAAGSFLEPGPATCWLRMRVPLVDGETPSPLTRVLVAADSGNGVSGVLDIRTHLFVNADLNVHLHRYPAGEWVCLDARTAVDADGIGLADTALHDESGGLGRATQGLFVAAR
ncbi:thioesterase family protein [Krasilnikovia sp. MM14-A1004]|uniref:thioesterase family protein n=1 Tax=Krasilnikovia sp. MM14-A1004 TaxID=3373541 RepID=UPI00399D3EAF